MPRPAARRLAGAPYIEAARKAGCTSLGELARALTARGIATPAGGRDWNAAQVRRILARRQNLAGAARGQLSANSVNF